MTTEKWKSPRAAYCYSCRFWGVDMCMGTGEPAALIGECCCDGKTTEMDDTCPDHAAATWAVQKIEEESEGKDGRA